MSCRIAFCCFPRARGDGPFSVYESRHVKVLPPRSRGWTRRRNAVWRGLRASPALAGMDPPRPPTPSPTPCFPRARGDGPASEPWLLQSCSLPPRSRGWTPVRGPHRGAVGASPALAGMDPFQPAAFSSASSFPRARGDGPVIPQILCTFATLPPRSRGWTRGCARNQSPLRASPALAGMDPCKTWNFLAALSFPRARGDGPVDGLAAFSGAELPPRSRGWTRLDCREHRPDRASPALAGMDPRASIPDRAPSRFPRARGDGPFPASMGC